MSAFNAIYRAERARGSLAAYGIVTPPASPQVNRRDRPPAAHQANSRRLATPPRAPAGAWPPRDVPAGACRRLSCRP